MRDHRERVMVRSTRRNGVLSAEIGSRGEAAVVKALHSLGFDGAERRRVRHRDALDVIVAPGIIASVKAGEYAKTASLATIMGWRVEADRKRVEQSADAALLVVQRRGAGTARADQWRTWIVGVGRDEWEAPLSVAVGALLP